MFFIGIKKKESSQISLLVVDVDTRGSENGIKRSNKEYVCRQPNNVREIRTKPQTYCLQFPLRINIIKTTETDLGIQTSFFTTLYW